MNGGPDGRGPNNNRKRNAVVGSEHGKVAESIAQAVMMRCLTHRRLFEPLAFRAALVDALAAGEVDEGELPPDSFTGPPVRGPDHHHHDQVRPRRLRVHLRRRRASRLAAWV